MPDDVHVSFIPLFCNSVFMICPMYMLASSQQSYKLFLKEFIRNLANHWGYNNYASAFIFFYSKLQIELEF